MNDDFKIERVEVDPFKRVDFAELAKRMFIGEDYLRPVFPEVPEGYDLVTKGTYGRKMLLPKPAIPADTMELANFANHARRIRFNRPLAAFGSVDLPTIRTVNNDEMEEWAGEKFSLGQYDIGSRNLLVLHDADIMAIRDDMPDGGHPFGTDDRLLINKSVLLHELVHWLQYVETGFDAKPWTKDYASLISMEREAWTIQAMWLNERGQTTSIFAQLDNVETTIERIYGASMRMWLAWQGRG